MSDLYYVAFVELDLSFPEQCRVGRYVIRGKVVEQ